MTFTDLFRSRPLATTTRLACPFCLGSATPSARLCSVCRTEAFWLGEGARMSSLGVETRVASWLTTRTGPQRGEIGCVGSCPLCSRKAGSPPCLACRDELRARLSDMTLDRYVERALN